MEKLLYIDACIRGNESRTRRIADPIVRILEEKYAIERFILNDMPLEIVQKDLIHKRLNGDIDPAVLTWAETVRDADRIVIAAPFWDMSIPAALKNFFELCSILDVTFKTNDRSCYGNCKAKKLLYITTRGMDIATGDPLIIEKCNLDVEVSKLNMLKANHLNQRFSLENMVYRRYPAKIAELKEQISGYEKDVATAQAHPKSTENFVGMEIYGTHHSEKEAAGRAIINACTDLQGSEPVQLGRYRGFSLSLQYIAANTDYKLTIKGAMSHTISLGADIYGNITRMDNVVDGLAKELEAYQAVLQDTQNQLANAKAEMETPFAREKELAEKSARLKELNILLNMDQKDHALLDDSPDPVSEDREKTKEQER